MKKIKWEKKTHDLWKGYVGDKPMYEIQKRGRCYLYGVDGKIDSVRYLSTAKIAANTDLLARTEI